MERSIHTICGSFNKERYQKLKEAYDNAVKSGKDKFVFQKDTYLISFTKYLLEFLEMEKINA